MTWGALALPLARLGVALLSPDTVRPRGPLCCGSPHPCPPSLAPSSPARETRVPELGLEAEDTTEQRARGREPPLDERQ